MKTKEELFKQKAEIEEQIEELEKKKGYVIRNRYDDSEIYVSKADNVKGAVIEAVQGNANLWKANLWNANLGGANLREADLGEVKFYGKGGTQKLKKDQVEHFLRALGFEIED